MQRAHWRLSSSAFIYGASLTFTVTAIVMLAKMAIAIANAIAAVIAVGASVAAVIIVVAVIAVVAAVAVVFLNCCTHKHNRVCLLLGARWQRPVPAKLNSQSSSAGAVAWQLTLQAAFDIRQTFVHHFVVRLVRQDCDGERRENIRTVTQSKLVKAGIPDRFMTLLAVARALVGAAAHCARRAL